eukprot:331605-Prorocentrum_minimum.AAC.2
MSPVFGYIWLHLVTFVDAACPCRAQARTSAKRSSHLIEILSGRKLRNGRENDSLAGTNRGRGESIYQREYIRNTSRRLVADAARALPCDTIITPHTPRGPRA